MADLLSIINRRRAGETLTEEEQAQLDAQLQPHVERQRATFDKLNKQAEETGRAPFIPAVSELQKAALSSLEKEEKEKVSKNRAFNPAALSVAGVQPPSTEDIELSKLKKLQAGMPGANPRAVSKPEQTPPVMESPTQPEKEENKKSSSFGISEEGKRRSDSGTSYASAVPKIQELYKLSDEDAKREFDKEYASLDNQRREAIRLYKEDKTALDWGRVGEMLGRSMVLLAAGTLGQGAAGMKGVAESEKWDWRTDYDALKEGLSRELETVEYGRKKTSKDEERVKAQQEKGKLLSAQEEMARTDDMRAAELYKTRESDREKKENAKASDKERKDELAVVNRQLAEVQKKIRDKATFKNQETLKAWVSSVFGEAAAEDVITKSEKGELWGWDEKKAKDALSSYVNQLHTRQAELAGGAPSPSSQASPPSNTPAPGAAKQPVRPRKLSAAEVQQVAKRDGITPQQAKAKLLELGYTLE